MSSEKVFITFTVKSATDAYIIVDALEAIGNKDYTVVNDVRSPIEQRRTVIGVSTTIEQYTNVVNQASAKGATGEIRVVG